MESGQTATGGQFSPRRGPWRRRIFIALALALVTALALWWWRGPTVPGRAVVVVDLRPGLPERLEEGLAGFLGGGSRLDLLGLRRVLLAAQRDSRVRGVLLKLGEGLELAQAEELRAMVEAFRRGGKFVLGFAQGADGPGTLVLSAADQVILEPASQVNLLGVSLRALFLGEALKKLGLEFDLVRVGEYKGAYEQLTSGSATTEFQKALEETAESLFTSLVEEIAASRRISAVSVRSAIDEAPLAPARAVELKLADRVAYQDELPALLAERRGGARAQPIEALDYLAAVGEQVGGVRLAVVHVRGLIADAAGPALPFIGEVTGADQAADALREARGDATVRGIVLRIDSPGGTITGAERIWREVEVTRKVKPVVVTMGSAAASGGYYIACAADRVIARPATITGSIGVFGGKLVAAGLLADHQVRLESASRGKRAGMFGLGQRFTDDQRSAVEAMVQDGYRLFLDRVAVGRKMGLEEVERLGKGRVWTGRQAQERGLVDELGGLEEAVAAVSRMAHIPDGEPVDLAPFPPRRSFLDLWGRRRGQPSFEGETGLDLEALLRWQARSGLLDGRRAMALLPVRLLAE